MFIPVASVAVTLLCLTSASAFSAPFYEPQTWHNRSGIVHLFEWKWLDIARECEEFLGPDGYAGVQISPPTENPQIWQRNGNRPWWERYQPISYRLISRSGNEEQFAEMTRRCNAVGVRIYADLVINHMTADIPDAVGIGGARAKTYESDYPLVPFTHDNFHEHCQIHDYNNSVEVRNCELEGRHDLDHAQPYVRDRIIDLMNRLIDLGVAGFRIDSAKYMWPHELKAMIEETKSLNTNYGFQPNSKPFVYQDVKDFGNEAVSYHEYTHIGRVVDTQHSYTISRVFRGGEKLNQLQNWGTDWNLVSSSHSVVSVNSHDNHREYNQYGSPLTFQTDSKQYKMAVAFMLAHPNGIPRILSSFEFNQKDQGAPMSPNGEVISPRFLPSFVCGNGYNCEHRLRQIVNMIKFRSYAEDTAVENWWDNGGNQIAFSRGNKAFIAFNNDNHFINEKLQTGLPAGIYCDVISGKLRPTGLTCTGKYVEVDLQGMSHILLHPDEKDGMVAIHIGSKLRRRINNSSE